MRVDVIRARNFKSLYEETEIDFRDMNGLWKLSGKVGAGKTTLGELILFSLYGSIKDKNVPDLVSWGAKECNVVVELESRGFNIKIDRTIRRKGAGKLIIWVNGEELDYTNKRSAQSILEEDYYDCSRTAIESLCIISFNNFKSIAQFSAGSKDTKRFVDDVFGFEVVNNYIDICKCIVAENNQEHKDLKTKLKGLENQKIKYERLLEDSETGVDEDEAKLIQDKEILEEECNSYKSKFEKHKEVLFNETSSYKTQLNESKTRGSILKKNLSDIENGVCPTCKATVDVSLIDNVRRLLIAERDNYKSIETNYNIKLKEYNDFVVSFNNTASDYVSRITSIIKKIDHIRVQKKTNIENYKNLLDDVEVEIDDVNDDINSSEVLCAEWEDVYNTFANELRPTLLSHYIPLLNSNIEYYIQQLQQPYTITFNPLFECTLGINGVDGVSMSSLSTGQLKSVNTAIIFGILKTLLSSINFNISFLDELFSNMHDDLREVTCLMLKDNIPMQVMFIITHAHINDELFDGELEAKNKAVNMNGVFVQGTQYLLK